MNYKPVSEKDAEAMIAQYTRMAEHIAERLGQMKFRPPVPHQEIRQESHSILRMVVAEWNLQNKDGFDRNRNVSPSTFIYSRIFNGLRTWCERQQPKETRWTDVGLSDRHHTATVTAPPSPPFIRRLLMELNRDAQIVVKIIINAPAEIADEIIPDRRRAVRARRAVQKYLEQQGWTKDRLAVAWNEIALAL